MEIAGKVTNQVLDCKEFELNREELARHVYAL